MLLDLRGQDALKQFGELLHRGVDMDAAVLQIIMAIKQRAIVITP